MLQLIQANLRHFEGFSYKEGKGNRKLRRANTGGRSNSRGPTGSGGNILTGRQECRPITLRASSIIQVANQESLCGVVHVLAASAWVLARFSAFLLQSVPNRELLIAHRCWCKCIWFS